MCACVLYVCVCARVWVGACVCARVGVCVQASAPVHIIYRHGCFLPNQYCNNSVRKYSLNWTLKFICVIFIWLLILNVDIIFGVFIC